MDKLVSRTVSFEDELSFTVNLNTPFIRYPKNPILSSHDVNKVWSDPGLQVTTVYNAGVTHEDVLIELCESYGQDPATGKLNFI